jgi:hypothetical protein
MDINVLDLFLQTSLIMYDPGPNRILRGMVFLPLHISWGDHDLIFQHISQSKDRDISFSFSQDLCSISSGLARSPKKDAPLIKSFRSGDMREIRFQFLYQMGF